MQESNSAYGKQILASSAYEYEKGKECASFSEASSLTQVSQKGSSNQSKSDEKPQDQANNTTSTNVESDAKSPATGSIKLKQKKKNVPPIVFNCLCKN